MINTALTRPRADNPHDGTWHIYSGDVRIGTIGAARRSACARRSMGMVGRLSQAHGGVA
ncbi:hypothetical protein M2189_007631 [Bradyrhizobium japonicum]|nr:hypothetical protein [Bradyrhizobium japonicum]MCS3964428.1 hypothetical protein [Bradyrhizobium japonicum]MCS3996738.1 hypothetical protein [Bradyrhizobium japonicum]